MKTLYLMRHAQAELSAATDFERKLDSTGKNEAEAIGKQLKAKHIRPQLIIISPANRAWETTRLMALQASLEDVHIIKEHKIYNADEETLLELIRTTATTENSLLLTGHNPGISALACGLSKDFNESLVTAGVVSIEFNAKSWKDITWKKGELIDYLKP